MRSLILVLFVVFLCACEDVKHPDMDSTMQELQNRKIVRLMDSEVVSHAGELGRMCLNKTQSLPIDSVQLYLNNGNKGELKYITSINDIQFEKEKQVWEAYVYSLENGLPLQMNLQETPEGNFLINKPVLEDSVFMGMWSLHLNREYVVQDISRE